MVVLHNAVATNCHLCLRSTTPVFALIRETAANSQKRSQLAGMHSPAKPSETPQDRLKEICQILAAGLVRLHARKSSGFSAADGESSLDCVGHQSGDPLPEVQRERV